MSVRASVEVGVRIVQDGGTRTKKCLQDIRVSVFGRMVDAAPEVLVQGSRESRVRIQSGLHAR